MVGLFDGTALERPVLCDRCGEEVRQCHCPPLEEVEDEVEASKQRLKIRLEKRKRGKVVTVVTGFRGSASQKQQLFTGLKHLCGAGGSLQEDGIEIQGEHIQRIRRHLEEIGFRI